MTLAELGWTEEREPEWHSHRLREKGLQARVIASNRNVAQVLTETQHLQGHIPGLGSRLEGYPTVGDWCIVAPPRENSTQTRILSILTRRNQIRRKKAGKATAPQVLACNVDRALLLTSRGHEFNQNRIDRYLTMIRSDQIEPIICLTKTDLDEDWKTTEAQVQSEYPDIRIFSISATTGFGLDRLSEILETTQTSVLLGSSGVGKSTLTNRLLNQQQRDTQSVRVNDGKGRHTTSNSLMFHIPDLGWLIDAPGIREIEPWDANSGVDENFAKIKQLAQDCRFRECSHDREKGCAVQAALSQGHVSPRVLGNYRRIMREQSLQDLKTDRKSLNEKKRRDKSLTKDLRRIVHNKNNR